MVNANLFPLSPLCCVSFTLLVLTWAGVTGLLAGPWYCSVRIPRVCIPWLITRRGRSQFGVVYLLKWARCPVPLESGQGFYHVAWETNCAHHLGMSAVLPLEQLCSPPGALTVLPSEQLCSPPGDVSRPPFRAAVLTTWGSHCPLFRVASNFSHKGLISFHLFPSPATSHFGRIYLSPVVIRPQFQYAA